MLVGEVKCTGLRPLLSLGEVGVIFSIFDDKYLFPVNYPWRKKLASAVLRIITGRSFSAMQRRVAAEAMVRLELVEV